MPSFPEVELRLFPPRFLLRIMLVPGIIFSQAFLKVSFFLRLPEAVSFRPAESSSLLFFFFFGYGSFPSPFERGVSARRQDRPLPQAPLPVQQDTPPLRQPRANLTASFFPRLFHESFFSPGNFGGYPSIPSSSKLGEFLRLLSRVLNSFFPRTPYCAFDRNLRFPPSNPSPAENLFLFSIPGPFYGYSYFADYCSGERACHLAQTPPPFLLKLYHSLVPLAFPRRTPAFCPPLPGQSFLRPFECPGESL